MDAEFGGSNPVNGPRRQEACVDVFVPQRPAIFAPTAQFGVCGSLPLICCKDIACKVLRQALFRGLGPFHDCSKISRDALGQFSLNSYSTWLHFTNLVLLQSKLYELRFGLSP
jgi:hypothetical protein